MMLEHPGVTLWSRFGIGHVPSAHGLVDMLHPPRSAIPENLLIFDDMWSVVLDTGAWAHEGGDCDVPNLSNLTRGTRGEPSAANSPQSRFGGNGWTDAKGTAWTFGGGLEGYTNDIWRFSWEP